MEIWRSWYTWNFWLLNVQKIVEKSENRLQNTNVENKKQTNNQEIRDKELRARL